MQPTLRCRPIRSIDVGILTYWLQKDFIDFGANSGAITDTVGRLLEQERIKGAIFEKFKDDIGIWQVMSIGISGFVHPEIIDAHLARPVPFLIHTLLSAATAKAPRHFMDPDEQAPSMLIPARVGFARALDAAKLEHR